MSSITAKVVLYMSRNLLLLHMLRLSLISTLDQTDAQNVNHLWPTKYLPNQIHNAPLFHDLKFYFYPVDIFYQLF